MKRVLSAPTHIDLCITNRCNISCKHCFTASRQEPLKELSTEHLKRIINRIVSAKVFVIIITGGEPLVRPDFLEIARYIRKYPIRMGLNTNGLLVTENISKAIAAIGFQSRISLSFDGSNRETYEKLRGPGTFKAAISGLESLMKYNKNIRLFCVVTKYNFMDLENIIKLAQAYGVPSIDFNGLLAADRAVLCREIFLTDSEKREAFQKAVELKKRYGNYIGGSFIGMAKKAEQLSGMSREKLLSFQAGFLQNCAAGFSMAAVRVDGRVAPCYTMLDYHLGDLRKHSLQDIWRNSLPLKEFRRMHDVSLDTIEPCKDCVYKGLCNGGCRAGAYYHSNKTRLDTYDPQACYSFLRE